jgi:hypothetical protein
VPIVPILPSIREHARGRKRCVLRFRAVSDARPPSLAVPGGAPRAGTDATLALAVPHARRTRGMHARPATPADSTLAVARGAFPVLPAMRAVRCPHGEARRRQQHHQTSRQNETMHHPSLLVGVRLLCRHRWPGTLRVEPVSRVDSERPLPIGTTARCPQLGACNTGSRRGSSEVTAGHCVRWRPSTVFAPAAPADVGALRSAMKYVFHDLTDRPRA